MKAEKSFNSLGHGLIPGILLPLGSMLVFWAVKFEGGFFEFLRQFQQLGMLSKVVSLSTIPNLLLFFLFIWFNRSFSARGVIFATLVVAFVMLVLKFA